MSMDVEAAEPPSAATGTRLARRALGNTVLLLFARSASRVIALVTVFATAAGLGDAGFGQFQTTVVYTSLVSVIVDLGFNTLYVREAARNPSELGRFLRNVLSSRLPLAAIGLGFLAAALTIPRLEPLLLPAFATMLLNSYANVLRSTFYATGRLGYEAVAIVAESVILLGLVLFGVRGHAPVAWYLWAYAVSYAFSTVYFATVITVRRITQLRWQFEPAFLLTQLRKSLPFAATFILTTIYFKADVPILQQFRSFQEVGWYQFAYKPFEALLFIPTTMLNVVFPLLGVYHRDSPDRFRLTLNRFYKALIALGWPITVGTVLLAPGINALFDRSDRFAPAAPALAILGAGIFLMFITNAFIGALNASDRQGLFTWAALASLVANVGLNLVLIPRFGYLGAAWATNLTELVLLIVGWTMVARTVGAVPIHKLSWRIVLAGLVMAVPLWFLKGLTGFNVLIAILLGMMVYAGGLVIFRAFDSDEVAMLRRALRRG